MDIPNAPRSVDDASRAQRRQKWYAIAEPIRGVYDSYERCQQKLKGVTGARRGPVEVSSEEEGWAVLNGGVRLTPGLYAFTDATAVGGVGVVMVRMREGESSEPVILEPKCSSSVVGILQRTPIAGMNDIQVVGALGRLRNILAEMVGLYEALNQLLVREDVASGSQITIVHDYYGVSAWMQAGRPPGATMAIDPGYYEAPFKTHAWGPAKDPIISAVVSACWELTGRNQLRLMFRHQPGHRSEEAGTHHFVRFNKVADELADRGSESTPS
jgi:hypothetical protein